MAQTMQWLLYTDANTRMNLLIDECAHLQQTVLCFCPNSFEIFDGVKADQIPANYVKRAWFSSDVRRSEYYQWPAQERALRNLWVETGALAQSIEAAQTRLREAFRGSIQIRAPGSSEDLFWFIGLRGHLLRTVFPLFLDQIQHAHEKLVQLLENMPGGLPGPTLMRRWSSAGYVEYLSDYSRQVNWRTQRLLWDSCIDAAPSVTFEDWRKRQFLVHAWTHRATSFTTRNSVTEDKGSAESNQIAFSTIWSSYFYLEQPILFPLLFHECAHHYLDRAPEVKGAVIPQHARKNQHFWFEMPADLAALLSRSCPVKGEDCTFWKDYVGEIWTDAVSIALCGDGFISALILDHFGTEGAYKNYTLYDVQTDTRLPLDEIGSRDRRTRNVQYPILEAAFFWPARIQIAIDVYRRLYGRDGDGSWIVPAETLIAEWYASGAKVMDVGLTSSEHKTFWEYRKSLNEWTASVIKPHVFDFVNCLRSTMSRQADAIGPRKATREAYALDRKLCELLNKVAAADADLAFGQGHGLGAIFHGDRTWVLEDLCAQLRCRFARRILADLGTHWSDVSDKWICDYADFVRNDGSIEVRLAIEWTTTVADVVRTAALALQKGGTLDEYSSDLDTQERDFCRQIADAVCQDCPANERSAAAQELALWPHVQSPDSRFPLLSLAVEEFKSRLDRRLSQCLGAHVQVGTFTLGVIRPAYISAVADKECYRNALKAVFSYYERCAQHRGHAVRKFANSSDCCAQVTELYGEYNYSVFEPYFTPVEKDVHPTGLPACIAKPRAVIRVSTNSPILSSGPHAFVNVSQIAFKFRWQWVLLAERLGQTAEVFLSSGWEDVIIRSAHADFGEYLTFVERHKLSYRRWQDIHSSLGLEANANCWSGVVNNGADKPILQQLEALLGAGRVWRRTGRFDVLMEWSDLSVRFIRNHLNAIGKEGWRELENIVTSLSMPASGAGTNDFKLSTHFTVRHDLH